MAEDQILHELFSQLSGGEAPHPEPHPEPMHAVKASFADCAYTVPGPTPFQCGNCKYFGVVAGDGTGICQIVEDPSSPIMAEGACKWFEAQPFHGVRSAGEGYMDGLAEQVDGGEE